jgi:glycosyltransferase involved in cell wall biosynthesis
VREVGDKSPGVRLGVYLDAVHGVLDSSEDAQIGVDPADFAFVGVFLPEVGRHFESVLLSGRMLEGLAPPEFVPLPAHVELVELPHYPALTRLLAVSRAAASTFRSFWRGLGQVDIIWVFGPHPFSLVLTGLALLRRKTVVLGVRQDSVAYYRARLPSRRWAPAMIPVLVGDGLYRLLARRLQATVVGAGIARRYGGEGARVLAIIESVVSADEIAPAPRDRDWSGPIELLTVGRLDAEKNPLLLVDAIARLVARDARGWKLTWVGGGPMEEAISARAAELGVDGCIELAGWVPFGGELLALYRQAHAFVHVSLTEGVPKVLVEALASALPIVATDVGGVSELLSAGRAGLLVPANDVDALVGALEKVANEPALREELVRCGLERVQELTLEAQADRVAAFLTRGFERGRAAPC